MLLASSNPAGARPATEASSGKAIRPVLVLLTAEAVGGMPAVPVPVAVAVELAHNFSLRHDDVMDGDVTRRIGPPGGVCSAPRTRPVVTLLLPFAFAARDQA